MVAAGRTSSGRALFAWLGGSVAGAFARPRPGFRCVAGRWRLTARAVRPRAGDSRHTPGGTRRSGLTGSAARAQVRAGASPDRSGRVGCPAGRPGHCAESLSHEVEPAHVARPRLVRNPRRRASADRRDIARKPVTRSRASLRPRGRDAIVDRVISPGLRPCAQSRSARQRSAPDQPASVASGRRARTWVARMGRRRQRWRMSAVPRSATRIWTDSRRGANIGFPPPRIRASPGSSSD